MCCFFFFYNKSHAYNKKEFDITICSGSTEDVSQKQLILQFSQLETSFNQNHTRHRHHCHRHHFTHHQKLISKVSFTIGELLSNNRAQPCHRHLERYQLTPERRYVQFNKSAGIKCEKSGPGHTGGCFFFVLSRVGHMDCVILVQD